MDNARKLYYGYVDTDIGWVLSRTPELAAGFAFVLVSVVDSTREVAELQLASRMMGQYPQCTTFGSGLLIPGDLFATVADEYTLFTGFDELWCFHARPSIIKPRGVSILPPPGFDESGPKMDTITWCLATECRLALADGFGMNYLSKDPEWVPPSQ